MPITAIATLKNWFRTAAKPFEYQYWAWMDSYWHKSELIPVATVEGLTELINNYAGTVPIRGDYVGGDPLEIVMPSDVMIREIVLLAPGPGSLTVHTESYSYPEDYDDSVVMEFVADRPRVHNMHAFIYATDKLVLEGDGCQYIIYIHKA
jgi:hypothetical protein